MGQVGALVGNLVDIEEARAGDMGRLILCLRIAAHVGQVPRGVEDAQVGVLQMGGEPFCRNQRFRIVPGHESPP